MTLLCSLDDFEAAVALHILTGQQFNRTEFERAVYGIRLGECAYVISLSDIALHATYSLLWIVAATGERLAKPLVELVFVLFDLDGGTCWPATAASYCSLTVLFVSSPCFVIILLLIQMVICPARSSSLCCTTGFIAARHVPLEANRAKRRNSRMRRFILPFIKTTMF